MPENTRHGFNKMSIHLLILILLVANPLNSQECDRYSHFLDRAIRLGHVRHFVIYQKYNGDEKCLEVFHEFKPVFMIGITGEINRMKHKETQENFVSNSYNLYFAFLKEEDSFYDVLYHMASMNFWRSRQRTIFIGRFSPRDVKGYSEMAFENYWATNLIFANYNFSSVMRYDPFAKAMLTGTDPEIIFQNTAYNLHGYQLNLATIPNSIKLVAKRDDYIGRDATITLEILKYLNASVKFTPVSGFGEILNNGSLTGMLKYVHEGIADASFASRFIMSVNLKLVDYTNSHDKDSLMLILPIQVQQVGDLSTILPWQVLILGIVLKGVFSIYLKTTTRLSLGKIFLINMQLLTARAAEMVKAKYYRIIVMTVILYYFCLGCAFQAKLVSQLTIPKRIPELTTIRSVADSYYKFNTENIFRNAMRRFEGPDKDSVARILSRTTYYPSKEFVKKINKCLSDEGFMTTQKLGYHYTVRLRDENGNRKICYYNVKQYVMPSQSAFILRRGSPLLVKVNKIVRRCLEAGLISYWERRFVRELVDNKITRPKKISIKHILPCIQVLGFGWIVSFLVFLYERGAAAKIVKLGLWRS